MKPYVDLAEIFGRNNNPIKVGAALSEQDEPRYMATLLEADQAGYRTQCACGEILNVTLCPRCGRKFE